MKMIGDIGVGLLIGVLINMFFQPNDPNFYLVIFGAFSALAPDVDFLVYMQKVGWKTDRWTHLHREMLHHPIPFSLGGAVLIGMLNLPLGIVWFFGTICHFIHDTVSAWGIRWGSPFFGWFLLYRNYVPLDKSHKLKRFIRNKDEQNELVAKYGDDDWRKNEYGQVNPGLVLEYILLAIGINTSLWWLFA